MVAVKPQCTLSIFQRLPCLPARAGRRQQDCQTLLLEVLRCCPNTHLYTPLRENRSQNTDEQEIWSPPVQQSFYIAAEIPSTY